MTVFLAQLWATIRQHPVIAACLLVAAIAGAANYPLWQQREAATRHHDDMRRKGEAMLAALTDRGRIGDDITRLAEAEEVIEANLVSEDNMEVNLGYFYRLEKLNRVRLLRVDQLGSSPPETDNPFKAVPISLQIAGSYRNLLAFVRELETGPRILRVRSFRLERADAAGNELNLVLMVDLLARSS
jgi:Tfp pilus assembly protein PilO